jgi:hypothetical protein
MRSIFFIILAVFLAESYALPATSRTQYDAACADSAEEIEKGDNSNWQVHSRSIPESNFDICYLVIRTRMIQLPWLADMKTCSPVKGILFPHSTTPKPSMGAPRKKPFVTFYLNVRGPP